MQINYRILGDVFSVSGGLELREKALACGLLPRILERLSMISGEKPRVLDEDDDSHSQGADEDQITGEKTTGPKQGASMEPEKNTGKKQRKGVGYSSKQG